MALLDYESLARIQAFCVPDRSKTWREAFSLPTNDIAAWTLSDASMALLVIGLGVNVRPKPLTALIGALQKNCANTQKLFLLIAAITEGKKKILLRELVANQVAAELCDISERAEAICATPIDESLQFQGILPQIIGNPEAELTSIQRAQAGILRSDDAWVKLHALDVGTFVRVPLNLRGLEHHWALFRVQNLDLPHEDLSPEELD